MLNYPDPIEHPNAYWQLTHDDNRLTERQKTTNVKSGRYGLRQRAEKDKNRDGVKSVAKRTETRLFLILA